VCFEKNLSTQQCEEKKNLWFLIQDEHKSWEKHIKQKEKKGEAEVSCLATLFTFALPITKALCETCCP
jgi:hypothetical protein